MTKKNNEINQIKCEQIINLQLIILIKNVEMYMHWMKTNVGYFYNEQSEKGKKFKTQQNYWKYAIK